MDEHQKKSIDKRGINRGGKGEEQEQQEDQEQEEVKDEQKEEETSVRRKHRHRRIRGKRQKIGKHFSPRFVSHFLAQGKVFSRTSREPFLIRVLFVNSSLTYLF